MAGYHFTGPISGNSSETPPCPLPATCWSEGICCRGFCNYTALWAGLLGPTPALGTPKNGSARSGAGATGDKCPSYAPRLARPCLAGSFSAPTNQRKRPRLLVAYALCGGKSSASRPVLPTIIARKATENKHSTPFTSFLLNFDALQLLRVRGPQVSDLRPFLGFLRKLNSRIALLRACRKAPESRTYGTTGYSFKLS
jgi:hypothetical protein